MHIFLLKIHATLFLLISTFCILTKLQLIFSGLNNDQDDVEMLLNQGIENLYRLNLSIKNQNL